MSFTGAYTVNTSRLTFVDPVEGNETLTVALDGVSVYWLPCEAVGFSRMCDIEHGSSAYRSFIVGPIRHISLKKLHGSINMKRTSMGTVLLAALSIGCSDSTGPAEPADLVGTWVASAFVFTNSANTAETVDVIALGMSMTLTFTETTMSWTINFAGQEQEVFTGTYSLAGNQITMSDPIDGDETFTFALDGNILTLTFSDTFDFNEDGQETAATAVMTLSKA